MKKRRKKQVVLDVDAARTPKKNRSVALKDALPLDWVGTQACDSFVPSMDGAFDLWPEGLDRSMFSSMQRELIIEWQRGWYRDALKSLLGLLHAGDKVIREAAQVRALGIRVLVLDFMVGTTPPAMSWRSYIESLPLRWCDVVEARAALAEEVHRRRKVSF